MKNIIFALLVLLSSCNMSRHYANYRYGGKMQKPNSVVINDSVNEISSTEPEFRIEEIKNQDSLVISERKINIDAIVVPIETNYRPQNSIPKRDTSFILDDELATAYSAAAFNGFGAIFGFLTFANANVLFFSLPLYVIALPVFNVIGIFCFFISLAKFSQGKIDPRNKKYYLLWLVVFGLSVLLALIPLLMFI